MGFKWNQDVTQKLMVMTLKLMLFFISLKSIVDTQVIIVSPLFMSLCILYYFVLMF